MAAELCLANDYAQRHGDSFRWRAIKLAVACTAHAARAGMCDVPVNVTGAQAFRANNGDAQQNIRRKSKSAIYRRQTKQNIGGEIFARIFLRACCRTSNGIDADDAWWRAAHCCAWRARLSFALRWFYGRASPARARAVAWSGRHRGRKPATSVGEENINSGEMKTETERK